MLTELRPWQWYYIIRDNLRDKREVRPPDRKDPMIEFRGQITPLSAAIRTIIKEEGKGLAFYLTLCSNPDLGDAARIAPKMHKAFMAACMRQHITPAFPDLITELAGQYFTVGHKNPDKRAPELLLRTHAVHFDPAHAGMVAFYASEAALLEGKRTFMRPGRYLEKFWGPKGMLPVLSAEQVTSMTREFIDNFAFPELKFVSDPDGWEYVYENGPKSCMKYNRESRYLHEGLCGANHPVRVYAHPDSDLALAYIEKKGQIVARTIVNRAEGSYLRIYAYDGFSRREMERLLEEVQYGQNNECLADQPLVLRWYDDGRLIVPCLEGSCQYVKIEGDRLVISRDGYEAQNFDGLVEVPEMVWAYVDETDEQEQLIEEDVIEVNDEYYTKHALRCRGFVQCDSCGHWGLSEFKVQYRGAPVCRHHVVECDYSGETILSAWTVSTTYDGQHVNDGIVVPIYRDEMSFSACGVVYRCYRLEWSGHSIAHVHFRTLQEMSWLEFVENFKVVDGALLPRNALANGISTNPKPGESYNNVWVGSECPPFDEVLADLWARREGPTPFAEPQEGAVMWAHSPTTHIWAGRRGSTPFIEPREVEAW